MEARKNIVKTNELNIVGTLVEVSSLKTGSYMSKDGVEKPYISAKIVVKCTLGDEEHLIELENFTNKYRVDGVESKLYDRIVKIEQLVNKKISVVTTGDFKNGTIGSNRFWSPGKKEVINSTKLNFTSIREALKSENDSVEFKFAGFVYQELSPYEDEDGNITHYVIQIAQANYNNTKLFVVPFVVEKDNTAAVRTMSNIYKRFKTIQVGGLVKTLTIERKREASAETETAFGTAIESAPTTFTVKQLVITTGDKPFEGEFADAAYTEEEMKGLLTLYKQEGETIKAEGEAKGEDSAPAAAVGAAAKAGPSLDDLI